ncbi:MAG: transposase family protein, partial [Candidatus Tectomicrobia bacterium]|nr:transposase family protein [Candidatus Tectomicrobia bacterium]
MIPRSSTKAMKKILTGAGGVAVPDFSGVPDPRDRHGRRFSLPKLLEWLLCGMLGAFRSLTALEALTERRGQPISDTTFYNLLALLPAEPFRTALQAQGHALDRAKALAPVGLPCHVLTIDNKTLYYGKERLNADCQQTHLPKSQDVRYHLRTVGAVLTSSPLLPVLDRRVIPPETNEMGIFPTFFRDLQQAFGRGVLQAPLVTLDSGFCSLTNATLIDTAGWGYVLALKGNQGGLLEEAQRVLAERKGGEPECTTPWESVQGRQVRRKLYRTDQLRDWETEGGLWPHLRQVWLVVQEERVQVGKGKRGRWG